MHYCDSNSGNATCVGFLLNKHFMNTLHYFYSSLLASHLYYYYAFLRFASHFTPLCFALATLESTLTYTPYHPCLCCRIVYSFRLEMVLHSPYVAPSCLHHWCECLRICCHSYGLCWGDSSMVREAVCSQSIMSALEASPRCDGVVPWYMFDMR